MVKRVIRNLNDNWYFRLNDNDSYKDVHYDHSDWERVTVPHDWSLPLGLTNEAPSGPRGGFAQAGIGWYRRVIQAEGDRIDRRMFIGFDSVFMNSRVYLNGELMGHRPYGYSSFAYDLTDHLIKGANILAVQVDCRKQPASRWYNGCGIFRPVELIETGNIHTALNGTYITTRELTPQKAQLNCSYSIKNHGPSQNEIQLIHSIYDGKNNELCRERQSCAVPHGGVTGEIDLTLVNPDCWSPETPALYKHVLEIEQDGVLIDQYETGFGMRKLEFIPQKGFFLNGNFTKFKGVCLHHDGGVVGAAMPEGLLRKRLKQLKRMGCNAVRTAHNPFSSKFYELCDELGLMVMDEIFDGWEETKADHDYGHFFNEWAEKDLTDWVVRDRNHPSVVIWSLGNEVHNMNPETTVRLRDLIKNLDSTRVVTCGVQGTGDLSDENRALLDIAGYNDGGGACFVYDRDHKRRPNQLFIATEAPHTFQTRGFYRTQTWWRDQNQPRREIENLTERELFFDGSLHYYSSYDNAGVRNCARDSWSDSEKRDYLLGEFRWSGFDYYGESMGWPARFFPSGVIDTANFEKDHYYLYQSMWTDYKRQEPMVHILPHWSHEDLEEGTLVPVWVYTNCPGAELFLNGKSLGKQEKGEKKHLSWLVPWTPGTIKALGQEKDGRELVHAEHITARCPDSLLIKQEFLGSGLSQVNVTLGEKENPVPRGENSVAFTPLIETEKDSPVILGTENGNPIDLINTTSPIRKAFYGKVMALVTGNCENLLVSALLGEVFFKESTFMTLAIQIVSPSDNSKRIFSAEISLNGGDFTSYKEPVELKDTTQIHARIYSEGVLVREQSQLFIKGEREKIIDLVHGNRVLDLDRTVGPFASKIAGLWSDGVSTYHFEEQGDFYRLLDEDEKQHMGTWWYDFPIDYLEVPDYAGQGEIWFNTGEKSALALKDQSAEELVLDNSSRAFRTLWNAPQELILTPKKT
jgi:beta-galactosidase